MLAAACALMATAPASAQRGQGFQPILMETEGAGPSERVTGFRVNPEAYRPGVERARFASNEMMQALAQEQTDLEIAQIHERARREQWEYFGLTIGGTGAATAFVRQFGALRSLDSALTGLGVVVTAIQVYSDLSEGRPRAAAANAFRGSIGLGIGYYGTTMMQLGNVAGFFIDFTLTTFATEAWRARTDAWRQAYARYFSERGRSLNDWKLRMYDHLRNAESDEAFRAAVDADLADYASRPWDSSYFFLEVVPDTGAGRAGLAVGASLTEEIRTTLEQEHVVRLKSLLIRDVFPEIVHRLWLEGLEQAADRANRTILPEANRIWEITVAAPLLEEPARFTLPRPAGGEWQGVLQPGEPRSLRMTTLAFVRAGGPDRIILHAPQGAIEQPIAYHGRRGEVTFGQGEPLLVSAYRRNEGDAQCEVVRISGEGRRQDSTETRPAPPADTVHFGPTPEGAFLFGRFSPEAGWQPGSLGRAGGDALRFSPPLFENIVALSECSGGFLTGSFLADAQCTLTREEIELSAPEMDEGPPGASARILDPTAEEVGIETRRTCRSPVSLTLTGAFMPGIDGWQYHSLEGAAGRALRDALRQGILHGIVSP